MALAAEERLEQAGDVPVICLINALLIEAVKAAVSDIHLEIFDHGQVARFRVDGVLQEMIRLKGEGGEICAHHLVLQDLRLSAKATERRASWRRWPAAFDTAGGEVVMQIQDVRGYLISTACSRRGHACIFRATGVDVGCALGDTGA